MPMKTAKLELDFRHTLKEAMAGQWLLTWHEDGRVNPGVPDISFVMSDVCETGWLELKAAELSLADRIKIEFEPSQPQWIERHARLNIPVLIAINIRNSEGAETVFIVLPTEIRHLKGIITLTELTKISDNIIGVGDLGCLLRPYLMSRTRKNRKHEKLS